MSKPGDTQRYLLEMIVDSMNDLEDLGTYLTFRTEEGWGTSLYAGPSHYLAWDGHKWAWMNHERNQPYDA